LFRHDCPSYGLSAHIPRDIFANFERPVTPSTPSTSSISYGLSGTCTPQHLCQLRTPGDIFDIFDIFDTFDTFDIFNFLRAFRHMHSRHLCQLRTSGDIFDTFDIFDFLRTFRYMQPVTSLPPLNTRRFL